MKPTVISVLCVAACVCKCHAEDPGRLGQWEEISGSLFKIEYTDYEAHKKQCFENKWRYGAKTASLAVDRMSGDLYASISNGKFYRSQDHGTTWEKVESARLVGRAWEGRQVDTDPLRLGRVAVFRIAEGYFRKQKDGYRTSGMTLDGGRTWISFTDPETDGSKDNQGTLKGHDGWTYGQVDWSEEPPRTMIAKQHHSLNVWASHDGGATWKIVHKNTRHFGLAGEGRLLAADIRQGGLFVSTDRGDTWKKTNDAKANAKMSVLFNGKIYWCAEQGVLVSEDKGETWKPLGSPLKEVFYGPYFGKDQEEMLVVGQDGFFLTNDTGATWRKIAPFLKIEDAHESGDFKPDGQYYTFGLDWRSRMVYAACVGGSMYRLKLTPP